MKTKIYLLIFVLLLTFAGYTFYNSSTEMNTKKEKDFKVENFEDVTKIDISDRYGKTMHFTKQDDKWILNDKFPVRQHLFYEMEEALTKMEARSLVPNIGKDAVIKQMMEGAIKVEIYKGKKKEKTIYVGGPNLKNTASHMFLEIDGKTSDKIYNVGIPGFRGFLTTRFVVNEDEWRSKSILSYLPNEISSIEVKYFKNATYDNFTLSNDNNNFSVSINDKIYAKDELNEANIVNYLMQLDKQHVTTYTMSDPSNNFIKDSLLLVNKFAEIKITNTENIIKNYTIVDMPLNESSKQQYDENGDPMKYDIDYKFVIFGEKNDWGVITNGKFGLLLVSPYLFLNNNIKE